MSYERDADKASRGVGAIAALDRKSGNRYHRQMQGAMATIRRDRAMSAIERGALGRMDLRTEGGPSEPKTGGGTKVISKPVATQSPPIIAMPTGTIGIPTLPPPKILPSPVITSGESPPIIAVPSGSGPPSIIVTGGPGKVTPIITGPALPDDEPLVIGGMSGRSLLLWGGVGALAAYFLFLRRRGS